MRLLNDVLEEKIKTLPRKPGVYLMRDEKGEVIYVGKAKVLKNRVSQYFGANAVKNSKTNAMVNKIADFEYIITDSEKEALILECNLIKEYQPHYNILLRDDKHYPYVRIDLKKDYPRVEIVRKVSRDVAHRLAITYHRSLREGRTLASELDRIRGIGPKRKQALIGAFGDLEGIKRATVDELAAVPGVDISTAREIVKYFAPVEKAQENEG